MNRSARLVGASLLTALLGSGFLACARKKPVATPPPPPPVTQPTPAPTPPPPPPPPPPAPTPPPAVLSEEELFSQKTLDQLNAEKPLGNVFFDYDRFDLREEARMALQKNAEWLKKWSTTKITVEGHCDSRGSSEYNLGLGERRATSVRNYLVSLGVGTDRVLSVSKGKEQPFCTEENEGCWSQNRRGHFIITAK